MRKNKFLLSLIAGCFCSLAFAPFHFFVAAMVSLSAFYLLLDECKTKKETFWMGFSYGFGYFLSGIYWIAISLLVDATSFAWLIPFALTLIPAALAAYVALFSLSYKFVINRFFLFKTYQKILVFTICWLFFEILRSLLFTGFPWNLLGYIWMMDVSFAQLAKVFGIYGLSVFAILICLFPTLFLKIKGLKSPSEVVRGDKILAVILLILFVLNFIWGYVYINQTKATYDNSIKLRLVQGNIKQEMKWDSEQKYKNFLKHINLSISKPLDNISAVIWSETAIPYAIDNSSELKRMLRRATPPQGVLISGALRLEVNNNSSQITNAWNSVFAFDKKGVIDSYDKHHLVPFGEYVPLQKYLPFVQKITQGSVGFSKGDGPKTIVTKDFSFSPLICYEVIFSDKTLDKKSRPDLLANLTNDAWFGKSSGPYQHFDMSKMRAIEYGIPMARVANSGITALIDPFGRVIKKIDLNQSGIIDVNLIKKLPPTIYEKYSYLPLALIVMLMLILLIFSPRIKPNNQTCYLIKSP